MRLTALASIVVVALATNARGIDLRQIVVCEPTYPGGPCKFSDPMVSPDGACVAFSRAEPWDLGFWFPEIRTSGIEGGTCPFDSIQTLDGRSYESPAWSPDGSRVAYRSARGGYANPLNGIWTLDVSVHGLPPQQIVTGEAWEPAWTLDGNSIAFVTLGAGAGVYVVPSTGGAASLVAAGAHSPAWGPDGQLAYVRDGDLWIRSAEGEERRLTSTSEPEVSPAWSALGWIAYVSYRAGTWDIWLISSRGGTPVQVTATPAVEFYPSWTRNADRLVFQVDGGGASSLWLASDLPDWTIAIENRSWSELKRLYR